MMRGLFGRSMPGPITGFGGGTFNMDGSLPDMASIPTTAGGRFGNPMPQQQMPRQSFWRGGSKFTGRDAIAGALAAIGDGLRGWAGGPTGAVEGLMASRMAPEQQAMAMAAEQRKRAADLADFRAKEQIKAEFAPAEKDAFDRALAGAGIDASSPEGMALYRQRAESMTRDPNDEFVVVPIPGRGTYAGPRSGMAAALGQGVPAPSVSPPRPLAPRPQGMTDDQLFEQGRRAVEQGAPIEEVFQRLRAWGVKVT